MKEERLQSFLKQKEIHIPLFWFQNYEKLKISLEELIFLMYLKEKGETFLFNPQEMKEELGLDLPKIMEFISSLEEKKLLRVETYKNDKKIVEERVNLSNFYQKYQSLFLEDMMEKEEVVDHNLFEQVEKEFGRTLSPSEIEFMKAWMQNFKEEIILEAVKEASLNGVSSIRYIDRILYEWDKQGIKKKEDVEHYLMKRKKKEEKEPLEVFDYDWFEEDEEE